MANCVDCGSPLPANQGSRTCSMCYGDINHGKDGYYRDWAERQNERESEEREYERRGEGEHPSYPGE